MTTTDYFDLIGKRINVYNNIPPMHGVYIVHGVSILYTKDRHNKLVTDIKLSISWPGDGKLCRPSLVMPDEFDVLD